MSRSRKEWYTIAGVGGVTFSIFATHTDFLKRSMTAPFKGVPNRQNPLVPEADGGPTLTDQAPKSGGSYSEYSSGRGARRGGADEQAGRGRHRDESNHDDDFTGGSGASDETPVAVGDVDSDFDALPYIGAALIIFAAGALIAYARRGSGLRNAHA